MRVGCVFRDGVKPKVQTQGRSLDRCFILINELKLAAIAYLVPSTFYTYVYSFICRNSMYNSTTIVPGKNRVACLSVFLY